MSFARGRQKRRTDEAGGLFSSSCLWRPRYLRRATCNAARRADSTGWSACRRRLRRCCSRRLGRSLSRALLEDGARFSRAADALSASAVARVTGWARPSHAARSPNRAAAVAQRDRGGAGWRSARGPWTPGRRRQHLVEEPLGGQHRRSRAGAPSASTARRAGRQQSRAWLVAPRWQVHGHPRRASQLDGRFLRPAAPGRGVPKVAGEGQAQPAPPRRTVDRGDGRTSSRRIASQAR